MRRTVCSPLRDTSHLYGTRAVGVEANDRKHDVAQLCAEQVGIAEDALRLGATQQRLVIDPPSATVNARPREKLDPFDRHLLTFLLKWAPFGGPAEDDCFVEFGMTANRVRERAIQILCASPAGYYAESDHRLLVRAVQMLRRPTATLQTPWTADVSGT